MSDENTIRDCGIQLSLWNGERVLEIIVGSGEINLTRDQAMWLRHNIDSLLTRMPCSFVPAEEAPAMKPISQFDLDATL